MTARLAVPDTTADTVDRPDPTPRQDPLKTLRALQTALATAARTNIGFPAATDIDYTALGPFLGHMLNNLGDPFSDGAYPMHTKAREREVIAILADLFGLPAGDRWGYVTTGATEAAIYALDLARMLHPDAIVYHSTAAHHSVTNTIRLLDMISIPVAADPFGEMNYDDLDDQLNRHRSYPAIVIANIGTAGTEAVDDITEITRILDEQVIRRRWIHADAALSGIPLALMPAEERPAGIDFPAGAHSIAVSGHKFFGTPVPCAAVLTRASHRAAYTRAATYTGSPDTTITNSRSGLAVLSFWYALTSIDLAEHRCRAERARALAYYAHDRLRELGVAVQHHRWAFTVSLPTPPESVTAKWALAVDGARSHLVCVPGVTRTQIDEFLDDLRTALPSARPAPRQRRRPFAATRTPVGGGPR